MVSDIIIIGGGAAGLMAAIGINSKDKGLNIILMEKMPRPGRKIMITGKGRCNFTNVKSWNDFIGHIRSKSNFLKPAFHNLPPEGVIDILERQGVATIVERGDRAFPVSHKSTDVVDALVRAASSTGCIIRTGCGISEIDYVDDKSCYRLKTFSGEILLCKKLIISTGGLSYPTTGSSGDGYPWAQKFGHSIKKCFPSLTAIVPTGYKNGKPDKDGHIDRSTPLSEFGKSLCGFSLKNVGLSLFVNGDFVQGEFGDIDFTDCGLEGPIGFGISRNCVKAMINGSKCRIEIDLKFGVKPEELKTRLINIWQSIDDDLRSKMPPISARLKVLLRKLMPAELIRPFIEYNPEFIKGKGKNATIDYDTLTFSLQHWSFNIAGYVGYERCVVTAGGISTDEILPKTMESRLRPGLYFCGEILDIDADTGGYNLQLAFSTGYLAGQSAANSLTGI